jgi:hypothetical protein
VSELGLAEECVLDLLAVAVLPHGQRVSIFFAVVDAANGDPLDQALRERHTAQTKELVAH